MTASAETGYVIVLGDPTEWVMNDDGSVTATVYFTDEPCPVPTPTPTPTPSRHSDGCCPCGDRRR